MVLSEVEKLVNTHVIDVLIPAFKLNGVDINKIAIVLGGSVASGHSDHSSDVDIYVYHDVAVRSQILKARSHLFTHKDVHGLKVQVIPMLDVRIRQLIDTSDEGLSCDVDGVFLYDIANYIIVWDPSKLITEAKSMINGLDSRAWEELVSKKACQSIDLIEGFYKGSRRDLETCLVLFGPAAQSVLELSLLSIQQPYPFPKWLLAECKRSTDDYVNKIAQVFSVNGTINHTHLIHIIQKMVDLLCESLELKGILPMHLINDLRESSAQEVAG